MAVRLEDKDENDVKGQKWQLLQKSGKEGFQIKSMVNGGHQSYFLVMTPESNLMAQNGSNSNLNTFWILKEGTFKKSPPFKKDLDYN